MDLMDRFRYVMKVYNETPSSFADKIGVQRSSISHILSGRNKPSLDFIQKIMEHYPKIDAQWLINGKQSNPKEVEVGLNREIDNVPSTISPSEGAVNDEEVSRQLFSKKEVESESEELPSSKSMGTFEKKIDKIIVFYTDNTFEVFNR